METPPEKIPLKKRFLKFIGKYKKDLSSSAKEKNNNTKEKRQDPIKSFYNELSCLDSEERKDFFVKTFISILYEPGVLFIGGR